MKTLMIMMMTLVGAHTGVLAFERSNWLKEQSPLKEPWSCLISLHFPDATAMRIVVKSHYTVFYLKSMMLQCKKKSVDSQNFYIMRSNLAGEEVRTQLSDDCLFKYAIDTYKSTNFYVEFVTPTK